MRNRLIDPTDLDFQLFKVVDATSLTTLQRFQDQDAETYRSIVATAQTVALDRFRNHLQLSDRQEPYIENGKVVLPKEIEEGVRAFHEAGFAAAAADEAYGGLQLPWTVVQAAFASFQAANIATAAYPFLTIAAANLIDAHGSEDQRKRFLRPMLNGTYFGTMALSETQAGSSLSDITTLAVPRDDGLYSVKGSKMWTSGGEHELSANIIHMVLARMPEAPPGVKGLSLFIVPRYRLDGAGSPTLSNDISLVGLNHKMGYRGTVNTALSFGENGECLGELVGKPNHGLTYMFHMMNEARIGVGMGAGMLAYTGYMESLSYATERRQGRRPGNKSSDAPQSLLIEHADIRRQLVLQKAIAEGCLTVSLTCARWVDEKRWAENGEDRDRASLLLDIVTPVLKSWFSDASLRANEAAIQIHGGYGYTRDFLVEQIYRDNRLNPIHEGTNGIQAIDLLGRKTSMENGAAFNALLAEIKTTIEGAVPSLRPYATQLARAVDQMKNVTESHKAREKPNGTEWYLAPAHSYMDAMGTIVLAWVWLKQGNAVQDHPNPSFKQAKEETVRYVFDWELPKAHLALDLIASMPDREVPYLSLETLTGYVQ